MESEHLSDEGQDVSLTRDDTDIHACADGGYVEVRYDDAGGGEQQAV
ncbi:hypothetical protein [Terribacillus sp. 7520-G]|nr:hypothetical protein [Terribacillus sp. 7520-G]